MAGIEVVRPDGSVEIFPSQTDIVERLIHVEDAVRELREAVAELKRGGAVCNG